MKRHRGESAITVIGALSSSLELGEMSPHKRALVHESPSDPLAENWREAEFSVLIWLWRAHRR